MNKDNYTSLELSKKLQENGFKGDNEIYWNVDRGESELGGYIFHDVYEGGEIVCYIVPAYDILNDLCVRYAKEMFGVSVKYYDKTHMGCEVVASMIIILLQQGKKQEAEDYIREHCLFNPKNKSNE